MTWNGETHYLMELEHHKAAFEEAMQAGCRPTWYDGILGWAWHCNCDDERHCFDQQCSVVAFYPGTRKTSSCGNKGCNCDVPTDRVPGS